MSRFIGCETAHQKLDEFVDGELSVDDQVLVETHLRWCRTCASRVEDHRTVGGLLRDHAPSQRMTAADIQTADTVPSDVLLRVRAEHDQAFGVRVREMFSDMRLVWFSLGATSALAICVTSAFLLLQRSTEVRPESLAGMISMSQPGSEGNPLLPDSGVRSLDDALSQYVEENRLSRGISIPRALDDGGMSEGVQWAVDGGRPGDDALFALQTVVSRDGRIANYRVLPEAGRGSAVARHQDQINAINAMVADAVRQSRFKPAQTPGGDKVAVNMLWVVFSTTAVMPPPDAIVRAPARVAAPTPALTPAAEPTGARTSSAPASTPA